MVKLTLTKGSTDGRDLDGVFKLKALVALESSSLCFNVYEMNQHRFGSKLTFVSKIFFRRIPALT